jgi:hypothetical protein
MTVPCLRHPWFPGTRTAVIRRRRSARYASHLTTRLPGAPAEKFPPEHPGPIDPDAFELHALTYPLDRGRVRVPPQGATVGFSRRNLLTKELVMRLHAQQTPSQTTRDRRTIPQAQRVELLGQLVHARQPYPLAPEQALDAV